MVVRTVSKVIVVIVVLIALLCNESSSQYLQLPPIPCPNVFEYAFDGNTYVGIITLREVSYGQTTVQIELTQPGVLSSHYSGKLSLNINKDRVFDYIRSGSPITYRVDFPLQNVVPRVTDITVNGFRICSGPKDRPPRATVNLEHTLRTYASLAAGGQQPQIQRQPEPTVNFISPNRPISFNPSSNFDSNLDFDLSEFLNPVMNRATTEVPTNPFFNNMRTGFNTQRQNMPRYPPPTAPPIIPPTTTTVVPEIATGSATTAYINSVCGQENNNIDVTKLAVNGEVIAKLRFPWIVAIYTRNVSSLSFQCGGSLISTRTVVSAAHCFQKGLEAIQPENLLLSMGRHNLNEWQNAVNIDVQKVITHPDFRPELVNFDADVAIIQLMRSVTFSLAIRPICLWQGSTDVRVIEGAMGIIVGWGEDESHTGVTAVPKLVNATIVSELTCIRSNERFYYLTSNRTLCAGNRDGSGPCMGDSGSGLMIRNRNKWMLRGTVSASLSRAAQQCNLDEYVVYSDIAKFIEWIKSNMIL